MNIIASNQLSMSSREIADLCDKRHNHVSRDIEKMLQDINHPKIGAVDFEAPYQDAKGEWRKEYFLSKDLTVTFITGYRADLRYRVVKRLEELEAQARQPGQLDLSDPVLLIRLLTEHASKRIEAEQRAASAEAMADTMREDVNTLDRLTKADGSLNITEAAKNLGMGPKDLFTWLTCNGWTYKRANGAELCPKVGDGLK
jgi:phage regulator Rha-like protein